MMFIFVFLAIVAVWNQSKDVRDFAGFLLVLGLLAKACS